MRSYKFYLTVNNSLIQYLNLNDKLTDILLKSFALNFEDKEYISIQDLELLKIICYEEIFLILNLFNKELKNEYEDFKEITINELDKHLIFIQERSEIYKKNREIYE